MAFEPNPRKIEKSAAGSVERNLSVVLAKIKMSEDLIYDTWRKLGGVRPIIGKIIGDQLFSGGLDPLKFIKNFDPRNTSGIFPDALSVMQQLERVAKQSFGQALAPLNDILGGDLLSQLNKFKSQTKSIQKTEDSQEKVNYKILKIIESIMNRLTEVDPVAAELSAELLDNKEIENITVSYYRGIDYSSDVMPDLFVNVANDVIKSIRANDRGVS